MSYNIGSCRLIVSVLCKDELKSQTLAQQAGMRFIFTTRLRPGVLLLWNACVTPLVFLISYDDDCNDVRYATLPLYSGPLVFLMGSIAVC